MSRSGSEGLHVEQGVLSNGIIISSGRFLALCLQFEQSLISIPYVGNSCTIVIQVVSTLFSHFCKLIRFFAIWRMIVGVKLSVYATHCIAMIRFCAFANFGTGVAFEYANG